MVTAPKSVTSKKVTLTGLGTALVTVAGYLAFLPLPPAWAWLPAALGTVGGLLGGKALLQRPGDVKAPL